MWRSTRKWPAWPIGAPEGKTLIVPSDILPTFLPTFMVVEMLAASSDTFQILSQEEHTKSDIALYPLFFNLDSYPCPPLSCKSTMQCKWDITQRKRQLNSEQNRENIVALPTQTASNPSDVSFRPPSAHLPTLRYFWKHWLSFRLPSAITSFSKMHIGKPESYPNRGTTQLLLIF